MKQWLMQFMTGRNGVDAYCRFLTVTALIVVILAMFLKGTANSLLTLLAYGLLIYSIFRMLSRNIGRRQTENSGYLQLKAQLQGKAKNKKVRVQQRKTHVFLACPSCKAQLRVPRGKGKIQITCPRCGQKFEGKS